MSNNRLFQILYYLLDKGHTTASELAAEFEVSVRTIYRDIETLSRANIPIYTETGRNGGICLLSDFVLDKAMFSETEKTEILTALQSMSATGYASEKEVLTKLSALFRVDAGDWLEVDFSRWGKHPYDNSKFERLKTAVIQHQAVKITYESAASGRSERTLWPLKLSYKSKAWYLKAFCPKNQDFRTFKLNRILDLELLEENFVPMPFPEPDEYQPEPPQIVLSFSKEIAYRVYDEFDETMLKRQENGDLIAFANMPVDQWLIGYLLSFGTQVEIIEPKYLQKIIAKEALAIYEKNKS